MHNSNTENKRDIKSIFVMLWELFGIIAIVLLIYLPNGNTVVGTLLARLGIKVGKWGGIGLENLVVIGLFLLVYFTSFKLFTKYDSTKLFSIVASLLMVASLVSAVIFVR